VKAREQSGSPSENPLKPPGGRRQQPFVRIGYDATLLQPRPAGVGRTVAALLRALLELDSGDEFVVYCGRTFAAPGWLDRPNVRLRRMPFPSGWKLARVFWQQLRLPFIAARDDVEVFHGPAYVLPQYIHAPSVLSAADAIALTHPHLCMRGTVSHLKRFLPKSCRLAGRIIAPTRASARALESAAGAAPERIRVIPHGIEPHFRVIEERQALEEFRRRQGLPGRFALFVGQIEPKKNLIQLTRAFFAAVMHLGLPHRLLVVGSPGWRWREVFREVRQLGLQDRVFFTGHLPDEAMPLMYNLAEALLMPSVVEGFGLPALEAAACGTPVLVSRDPALLEVTGEAALQVDAASLAELRQGIESLLTDENLRLRLRRCGPGRARQFTWERAARATLDVYRELLEEDRHSHAELRRKLDAAGSGGRRP
jgi:glycosyltransferase involved in cell wall biosynthesis